ncbi:hypothetical protein [Antrihabitans cavernicola]|uniref:DoxX family membrane protein n=1 Tax=Antrihabitans cavernicola TaxID=2495913 RepID=A0A5A7S9D4_9NOCA|nr:hypothetical protein [Spelaeibacter cavernicola]KAA0021762.1 hypothetical protein FOY51_17945 [Spelaeibacter cavernicola]
MTRRRTILTAAALLLVVQVGWIATGGSLGAISVVTVIVAAVVIATGGRWIAIDTLGRIYLGLVFAGSVADRFGALGAPGADGVSWGNYGNFVDYTRDLLPGMLHWAATGLALAATVVEAVLACALILGVRSRLAASAGCAVVAVFGLAMWTSVGFDQMASYAVPAVVGALAILGTVDADRHASAVITSNGWQILRNRRSVVRYRQAARVIR